ncbi:BTAD domain-containing putative transcriptional regulator [Actinoallomurus bryophytorum]|uniref:BTAD domain-containing putative transcriptional regulator n=1 Tax=Actinoallomurus bryophytorum TaxID=1490222 RepID=UPI001FECE20D|nr:BTAD domain-containing putative transcriptional regulator [Actinoallomurus bryophytorum]
MILLAGVPAGLATFAGSPIPHALPTWDQITATLTRPDTGNALFLAVIKVIGWAAWCLFTVITLAETAGYRRGRPPRGLPGAIRPMQHLARDLVAMAALIVTATAPAVGSTAAALSQPTTAATTSLAANAVSAPTASDAENAQPSRLPSAHHPTRTTSAHPWQTRVIKRGDTLWAIARKTTGSGAQYPSIFNASKHLNQPHGLPPLTDPDRIYPGQHIKAPPKGSTSDRPARRPAHTPARPHPRPPMPPHAPTPSATPPPTTHRTPPAASQAPDPPAWTTPTAPPTREPGPVTDPPDDRPTATPTRPGTASETPTPSSETRPPQTPRPKESPTPSSPGPVTPETPGHHHDTPVTVMLPTGAYLGIGLAAAISVALAATRLHRRRRRTPATEWPDPTTEPATPAPVAKVRKAHLDTYTEQGEPLPTDADLIAHDATTPAPTHVTAGTRDGEHLIVELSGLNLSFTGPGATGTVRALMIELLAKSSRYRVELIIPEPDATALLAGSGLDLTDLAATIPGLIVSRSLQAAITHLESEFIHRARLLETTDQADVHALRTTEPGEPLPAIILIATMPASGEALQAILSLSAPYCVGALLLGTWAVGTTLHVSGDGTVTDATGPTAGTWAGGRLFHLTAADAADMLNVVRTARGAPETAPPAESVVGSVSPSNGKASSSAPAATSRTGMSSPRPSLTAPASDRTGQPIASAGRLRLADAVEEDTLRPIRLRLLGQVRVESGGEPITTGLRRITRDLMAYLALHPAGITREQGVDALMPDRELQAGTTMFHTAISNARKTLRDATGLREPMFIIHAAGRYRLDPHLITVDLWQLQSTLNRAHNADTDATRLNALRLVPDLYTAELAEDLTFEWAETERENLRRQATDALSRLAQLAKNDHPDLALAALEHALAHDPYAEPLYRDLMRIQAASGHPDAVRRTHQQLKTRLADLDTEPDEETHKLLLRLLQPPPARGPGKRPPSTAPVKAPRPVSGGNRTTATIRPLRPQDPA